MTHDYKGTAPPPFAALSVLDGAGSAAACSATGIPNSSLSQHRRARGRGRQADPRRARQLRHPQTSQSAGLASAPFATFHFTPPRPPLYAVENFFSKIYARIRRGVFLSSPTCKTRHQCLSRRAHPAPSPSSTNPPSIPTPTLPSTIRLNQCTRYHRWLLTICECQAPSIEGTHVAHC